MDDKHLRTLVCSTLRAVSDLDEHNVRIFLGCTVTSARLGLRNVCGMLSDAARVAIIALALLWLNWIEFGYGTILE